MKFNQERAAAALIDAIFMGDQKAAEKYEVSYKSIQGWRARLATDEDFRQVFLKRKATRDANWSAAIPATMEAGIKFIRSAAQDGDHCDPEMVGAIINALETLSDIALTWKVIDERSGKGRKKAKQPEEIPTEWRGY